MATPELSLEQRNSIIRAAHYLVETVRFLENRDTRTAVTRLSFVQQHLASAATKFPTPDAKLESAVQEVSEALASAKPLAELIRPASVAQKLSLFATQDHIAKTAEHLSHIPFAETSYEDMLRLSGHALEIGAAVLDEIGADTATRISTLEGARRRYDGAYARSSAQRVADTLAKVKAGVSASTDVSAGR